MTETVYSAQPELLHPARFFGDAMRDLRQSPHVAANAPLQELTLVEVIDEVRAES